MSTVTVSIDETSALAAIAAGLNGGRFAHLVTDASVKDAAMALVQPARAARRRLAARKSHMRRTDAIRADLAMRAEWFAEWRDYSATDAARIDEVFATYASAPKRSRVRKIARALLAPETFARSREYAGWDAADIAAERRATLADWRTVIRAYADARETLARVGSFAISRADATASSDSRFYRHVVKHWHAYAGGRHVAIHGVTPDDVLQDAMVSAIAAGDCDDNNVPTFGSMYMHSRRAVESAVYTYRRGHSHSESFTAWTWADWQEWSERHDGSDRLAHSTMPEWAAYVAARNAHDAMSAYVASIDDMRADRQESLGVTRSALAALIRQGWTVVKIANMLGRTVEAIAADMERNDAELPVTFLPSAPVTDATTDDAPIVITRRQTLGDIVRNGCRIA